MSPELLNIILIAGAVCYGLYGLNVGIIRQLGSVAALGVGYLASKFCSEPVSQAFGLNQLLCAVGIFILAYLGVGIIARVLRKTAKMLLLGPLDRVCGAVFGILNWLMITSLLLNLFALCKPDAEVLSGNVTRFTLEVLPAALGMAQQYIPQ